MSVSRVKEYLKKWDLDDKVMEFEVSSATVALAAQALGVCEQRIAKTLSFKDKDESCILIVAAGDARVDNKKYKAEFGCKAKMLTLQEAIDYTGHAVGGVCPFALPEGVKVYLDKSLCRFETVFPACGSANSAIELTLDELFETSGAVKWVDISKIAEA